jgi:hypothetical protein
MIWDSYISPWFIYFFFAKHLALTFSTLSSYLQNCQLFFDWTEMLLQEQMPVGPSITYVKLWDIQHQINIRTGEIRHFLNTCYSGIDREIRANVCKYAAIKIKRLCVGVNLSKRFHCSLTLNCKISSRLCEVSLDVVDIDLIWYTGHWPHARFQAFRMNYWVSGDLMVLPAIGLPLIRGVQPAVNKPWPPAFHNKWSCLWTSIKPECAVPGYCPVPRGHEPARPGPCINEDTNRRLANFWLDRDRRPLHLTCVMLSAEWRSVISLHRPSKGLRWLSNRSVLANK